MYWLDVLVVDDEPGMRLGIVRALSNYVMQLPDIEDEIRFRIDTAENGQQGIEKINANPPEILLLDYKLPDMTGIDILEQIESIRESIQTVMVTAYASLDTAVSAIKSGAFDFLAKPFTLQELRSVVSKAARNLIHAKQIKKLNEEKRQVRFQFISVLGHELKSPLGAIEGYLNMIQERTLGGNMEEYDTMINRCLVRTDQMAKLIADLLEMTKIESGQRQREIISVDLVEITKNSIESSLPSAEKHGISINLNAPNTLIFNADKSEMEIVMNNLVSNAVKYNRDNGEVNITLEKHENQTRIVVSDTGIGMSEEECEKLFKEFSRIKNKKTKDILGSGLGLSTVKKIAQLYKGDATVSSIPDEGSTFTVILNEDN